jgi:hypothetical protein
VWATDAAQPGLDAAVAGRDASMPRDAGPICVPACTAGKTCLVTSCVAVSFTSVCGLGRATSLVDGTSGDDAVGSDLAAALAVACGGSFTVTSGNLSDPSVFDAASGQLLTPKSELALTTGGFFYNKLVSALEDARWSPLYFTSSNGTIGWAASATDQPVKTFQDTTVTATHDFFVVELFPDGDGRLALVEYGIGVPGTQAAGRQAQTILASPASYPDTWYVYEWTLNAGANVVNLVVSGK